MTPTAHRFRDHRHGERQPPALPRRPVLGRRLRRRRALRAGVAARADGVVPHAADAAALHPSVYLGIDPDGTVHIVTHRSEMGTGIRTSLPMVAADELDADWARVKIVQGIGDARYGDQNTDGSKSIRDFFDAFRQAGASARAMLIQAAAAQWQVPVAECETGLHEVVHKASGRRAAYGSLVPGGGEAAGAEARDAARSSRAAPGATSARIAPPTTSPTSSAARPSSGWTPRSTAWCTRRSSTRRCSARR